MLSDDVQPFLMEYRSLREEIQRRSNNQMICVTASIASVGVIIGFINATTDIYSRSYLLLMVPWILSVFGIIWLDHNSRIFEIGRYIRKEIEVKLKELLKETNSKWNGWESYLSSEDRKPRIVTVLSFIYFIVPSIVSLLGFIFLFLNQHQVLHLNLANIKVFLEITGILISIIFIVMLINFYKKSKNKMNEMMKG